MTVRKLKGSAIQSGTITTTQLSSSVSESISAGGGPKISSLSYPGDDLAANTAGGQTVQINGSGFAANSTVYLNGNAVASVTYNSSSNLIFTTPALSAATYPVYVINPEDGATAIFIPGLEISGEPTWNTAATLSAQDVDQSWNIALLATSDSSVTYALAEGSSLPSGITLASNGLISGTFSSPPTEDTTYNFTVIASDAENQDASRAFSVNITTGEGVLFANTVLLLHGDGTNNQNNNVFLDSSNNNFTITRNGNATQGSFSPFSQTGWSNYFDGSGDYLAIADTSQLKFGTGDFTVEAWVYMTATPGAQYAQIIGRTEYGTNGDWMLQIDNDRKPVMYINNGFVAVSSQAINLNAWTHIAASRDGSVLKLFVDGVQSNSVTSTASTENNSSGAYTIGSDQAGDEVLFTGYISNLRIVKGTALYTENFTPSTTPLQPIANTSLLTCQSNAIVDEGPNNFAITRNGDVSVQPFSPFAPVLTSANSHSVYFDGSGDYLTTNTSSIISHTADFSVEMWIYPTSFSSIGIFYDTRPSGTQGNYVTLYLANGVLKFSATSGDRITGATLSLNVWYHVALIRNNGVFKLYLNGVQTGSDYNNSDTFQIGVGRPFISGDSRVVPGNHFTGYVSNLRVLNSYAIYTSNFTPPTAPLTNIANTSLLTCQSPTFVDNSDNNFTITANGNAAPRKFNPFGFTYTPAKYSTANVGGSGYFDGSGDYLTVPTSTNFTLTGDFTIEFWINPSVIKISGIISNGFGSFVSGAVAIILNHGTQLNKVSFWVFDISGVGSILESNTILTNTWTHLAIVRSGSTITLYQNGVSVDTYSSSSSIPFSTTLLNIGKYWNGDFHGYISNLRIIKGTALYTSNFTPPSAPVTNIANTSILCNFTNAGIFDSTAKNVLETVGDAKVSTSVVKYGTGSIYIPSTNDTVRMPGVNLLADFTIEGWAKPAIGGGDRFFIFQGVNEINGFVMGLTTSQIKWRSNGQTDISAAINKSDWYHFAIVRSGSGTNNVKVYVDGSQVTQGTYTNQILASVGTLNIGPAGVINSAFASYGYIDDFRISRFARYTSNFTPPTSAFKDR